MRTDHEIVERKFYQKMNKKRSFLLSLAIVGVGYLFLCIRCWSIGISGALEVWLWLLVVGILFVVLTLIGYFVFEYERKKYTKK